MPTNLTQAEILRYSRHLMIPEVGLAGQEKLKKASVLIVGTGGLGSPTALYLAAAGIGRIGLVDYDVVEESNLQRQIIHGSAAVGVPKVESARARLLDINPYIEVQTFNQLFDSKNAREISAGYDLLIDGTDNFPTRYLMNDLAVLTGRPYIYGSIFRFEGQVSVFDSQRGPCYRCLFPLPPSPGSVPACSEAGVFGVLPGTIGTIQAAEAIKIILGVGEPLIAKLALYDALEMSLQIIQLRKNPACPVCGPQPSIHDLIDYEAFCGVPAKRDQLRQVNPNLAISAAQLAARMRSGEQIQLVDVRHPIEQQVSHIPGSVNIPLEHLPARMAELDPGRLVVLYCRTGERSARGLNLLVSAGYTQIYHLDGGINAWVREVDPE